MIFTWAWFFSGSPSWLYYLNISLGVNISHGFIYFLMKSYHTNAYYYFLLMINIITTINPWLKDNCFHAMRGIAGIGDGYLQMKPE